MTGDEADTLRGMAAVMVTACNRLEAADRLVGYLLARYGRWDDEAMHKLIDAYEATRPA